MTRSLFSFKRIVVKIGSSLLVEDGQLRKNWLDGVIQDIVKLKENGSDIMLVSSGAIALGRSMIGKNKKNLKLVESQAAASVGQILLGKAYAEALNSHGLIAGQILLTLADTEERRRYLNARETIETLFQHGVIPIVNENDTVATTEIRYGDNDRLAARVATMTSANLLVLLSDIDGLYSTPPTNNPNAEFIPEVQKITPDVESMAGDTGSDLSRGGMKTKLDAAKIVTAAGTAMVICSGREEHPLERVDSTGRATWFPSPQSPATARKKWISGHLETKGAICIDSGAIEALKFGKSLLPAGVISISGEFTRGDAVLIVSNDSTEIGRGLVAYDHADANLLVGRNSSEIEEILGYAGRAEMIHRDDLVLNGEV